jgi:hypothetical protein
MRTYLTLPKPIGIYPYFDKIQFWVREPLNPETVERLRKQCGSLYDTIEPARFNPQFRHRIELRQPSKQALRWLARRDDALINRVEIALDLIFKFRADVEEALDFLHQHLVRRWHGKNQEIQVFRLPPRGDDAGSLETRYDAGDWAPNALVLYRQDHSRVTGELNCLHIEWRVKSVRAMRAAGIESCQDLLQFDHRGFWKKRLLLYKVDRNHLGLLISNRRRGTKRRLSRTYRTNAHLMDGEAGEFFARAYDTVQELIDRFKPSIGIHRAMIEISNESLLPE